MSDHVLHVAGEKYFETPAVVGAMNPAPLDDGALESLEMEVLAGLSAGLRDSFNKIVREARRSRESEMAQHKQAMASLSNPAGENLDPAARELVQHTAVWVKTMIEAGHDAPVPSDSDIDRSALFRRIRGGKSPLRSPPPTSHGFPWYEIIESMEEHTVSVTLNDAEVGRVRINECDWNIMEVRSPTSFVVRYHNRPESYLLWGVSGDWQLRRLIE